jgi:hypothetical protein
MRLESGLAAAFARVAIANVARPYPHKLDYVLEGPEPAAADHLARHPVLGGSYDWHSAVHMHWLLVRVLRLFPTGEAADAIRETLERLREQEPVAAGWAVALDPLARDLARRLADFVQSAPYPVRAGTHGNTAFACLLALDYAAVCHDRDLETAIRHAAVRWYARDRDARPAFEPSLTDFLSPILCEAALMAAVLPAESFGGWFESLLPDGLGPLAEPPVVADRGDPQVVHLDGLGLSRAWCLRRVAAALPPGHGRLLDLHAAAEANFEPSLPHSLGGEYVGEHWLASFAALAMGEVP